MNRSDVPLLKAGIVSDIHVLAHEHDWGLNNFANALKIFQEKKIDLLINAGDLAEDGDPAAYDLYWKYIERHFPGKTPEHIACEGNHDCSGKGTFKEKFAKVCRGLRRECVNPEHRVIGGYDFITFATYDRLNYAESELPALEHEIRKAVERDPQKPVFVITHLPPAGTVSETGSAGLLRVFKKYPQVISLSGHTHIPLGNERSIWQGEFSAVGTSTLAYGCLEGKCLNTVNTILPFAREVTEALYMEIFADRLEFHRFNVTDGRELGPVWRIEIPYDAAVAPYTPRRALQAQPPEFSPEAQILLRYDYGYAYIIFDRAVKGDTAIYYEVEIAHQDENTKQYETPETYRYAADFYRFERNRQDRIYLKLPGALRDNAYCRFRVYGVEAFGRRGKPLEMVCRLWPGYKFKNAAPLYPQE